MSESLNARAILLAISKTASRLFRNNTGVAWTGKVVKRWRHPDGTECMVLENPRPLRAGLTVGSSDYIGWTPVKVTPDMVGRTLAVFTAIEAKASRSSKRTPEQIHFIDTVKAAGGKAGFAVTPEEAVSIVQND